MSKSIPNDVTLPWLPPWNCQMVNIPKFWAKRWRIMSLSNIAVRLAKTWAQYLFWQGAFIQYNHPKEFAQGLQVSLSQISWIDYRHHSTILPARMGPKIVHGFSALLRRDMARLFPSTLATAHIFWRGIRRWYMQGLKDELQPNTSF